MDSTATNGNYFRLMFQVIIELFCSGRAEAEQKTLSQVTYIASRVQRSPLFVRKEPWRNLYPAELSPRARYELDLFYVQDPCTLVWHPKKQLVNMSPISCPQCKEPSNSDLKRSPSFLTVSKPRF